MPKKAQTTTKTTAATAAKSKKVRGKKQQTVTAPVETETKVELMNEVVEPVEAVEQTTKQEAEPEVDLLGKQFAGVIMTLGTFRQSITALQAQVRGLEKQMRKEMKALKKEASKNKAKGNRKPSGFAKPSKVSQELCTFMGKEAGTEIARTEVTQYLIQYIKDNELQFPDNKKVIVPDSTLKKLLGVKEGDEVTYFNLQRLMNKHFVKKGDVAEAEA